MNEICKFIKKSLMSKLAKTLENYAEIHFSVCIYTECVYFLKTKNQRSYKLVKKERKKKYRNEKICWHADRSVLNND